MRILSVVGARPQFVKLAPIAAAMTGRADHVIVHTGQHYDELMSDVFFRDLGIPAPEVNHEVGSGSHGAQTGRMLEGLEREFERLAPDWVLVYGDTNSTVAAALAAVKLHIPVAHLEAGLRSFNRRMPEEHNRVLTDHAADLLLAHPRLRVLADQHGIPLDAGALRVHEPLAYPDLVAAVLRSAGVVTDSGGLQKEAFLLRVPATTLRRETEWVETVDLGWNVLAAEPHDLPAAVTRPAPDATDAAPYGDGHAADAVVSALLAERR
jgi:UDP-N-acetylglucosamine 2-epimerase